MTAKPQLPNPLQICFGQGRLACSTYRDGNEVGIRIKDTGEPHKVGDILPTEASPHQPEPGEIYLNFPTMESAIVILDCVTDCLRQLAGFPAMDRTEPGGEGTP